MTSDDLTLEFRKLAGDARWRGREREAIIAALFEAMVSEILMPTVSRPPTRDDVLTMMCMVARLNDRAEAMLRQVDERPQAPRRGGHG